MEQKFNKETYLKAMEKIEEIKHSIQPQLDNLEKLENFLREQEEIIDATFDDTNEPEEFEITDTISRVKTIGNSVNTEGVAEDLQENLKMFGEKGKEIWHYGMEQGSKISYNRTKFTKGMKEKAKEHDINITEMIKAVEEKNSKKTIKFKTVKITE